VYALTIIAGAIGEWSYYILGSAVEVALLAAIVYYAWTWPRATRPVPTTGV
jgi:predicted ferric reductase